MAHTVHSLFIVVLLAQTGRLQDTQCMQGFLDESVLRSKAALIGRTVERQREQVIIPSVKFTCSGTLTGWRFVAQRVNGRGRDSYPEIQVWRPQTTSPQVYDIVSSVRVSPQSTSQTNVYTHTLVIPVSYQAGDVLGLYHPSADTAAYKILSVENGGPNNYFLQRQDRSSEMFNTQSSGVRVHRDFPLAGAITSSPRCLSGFLSGSDLNARGQALSGQSRYQALSEQQRLSLSLTYGCNGMIGRILVAGQNRGTSGSRNMYPEIHMMRSSAAGYYFRLETFELNTLTDVKSPNVLEFIPRSTRSIRPGDVIRLYQPESSESVYEVYHEPGVGPTNYFIDGISAETRNIFPLNSVSMQDNSQPLFIVELVARCPSLQNPSNGQVGVSGSVASYECASGYRLDGQSQRLCDNDTAQWIGTAPQCTFVDCGSLPEVANGQVTLSSGTGLGSEASYSCDTQYLLDGSRTRRCMATNEWSGQVPICRRLCSTLSGLANGFVSAPSRPVEGDSAQFSCQQNYELVGETTATCQADGQWSPDLPSCQLIQCLELASPANGVVILSNVNRRIGSTATFRCNRGYQLSGEATLQCLQNRQWSAQPPTCQLIECQPLSQPPNGAVSVSGSEAVYACNEGYQLVGFGTITCQTGGVWSPLPPTCEPIQCPVLFSPMNGRVQLDSRFVGSSANYTCFFGYRLVGEETVVCQLSTRHWSHSPPTCELIDCGQPEIPRNSYITLPSGRTYLGDYALYSCVAGYTLEGREPRVCQENGMWSGEMPSCSAVDCGPAPEVPHAEVTANGSTLHEVATYRCVAGYEVTEGESQLVCQQQGTQGEWEGTLPVCTVVTCGKLPAPVNGDVFWESTDFNSVASYTCHEGFSLIGASKRQCLANGFWSARPPRCVPVSFSTTATTSTSTAKVTEPSELADPPADQIPFTSPSPHRSMSHPPTSDIRPMVSNVPTSDKSKRDANTYIVWAMIALLICLIILVVILIIVVYLRKKRTSDLDSAAANSVENPVYSGHGGTPLETLNCFRPTSDPRPCSLSGLEMHGFSLENESELKEEFGVSNGVHLYDFPSVDSRSSDSYSGSQDGINGAVVGHSYEFPDHYHLATQYEVPVSSYEKPRPRRHSYKNTLPPDIYVPTLEQREKASLDVERQVSCQSNSTLSPTALDENVFFAETETYWRPASDPASLYEQLARNKYREINRNHIQVTELLGSGQFGQVKRGVWQNPAGGEMEVAVKTLKKGVTEEDKVRFLQEAAISGQFQHPNVVRLQGVVTVGEPIMIILELLPTGDLRGYLMKQRIGENLDNSWPKRLLHFCRDIASGMTYLSSKAFVHRDLAARNILVAQDHTCKIGDFGLSRDLDEENYYISNGGKIPVKWTAPEALHYKKYSTASDVWSFGCLMYEIWSLGHKPFEKSSNAEAIKMMDQGFRLPPPPGCPRALYQLMIQCWHPTTSSRPAFHVLLHALSRDSRRLLSWGKGDTGAHSQAPVLGAPLEAGLDLYVDLQRTYIRTSSTTSSP